MTVVTKRYIRKPLYVEAIRITTENFEEIREWIGGEIKLESEPREGQTTRKHYIKFDAHSPKTPRQKRAYVGDWMLYTEQGFKVYTQKAFHAAFDLADEAAQNDPARPNHNPAQERIDGLPEQQRVELGEDEMIAAGAIKEVGGRVVDQPIEVAPSLTEPVYDVEADVRQKFEKGILDQPLVPDANGPTFEMVGDEAREVPNPGQSVGSVLPEDAPKADYEAPAITEIGTELSPEDAARLEAARTAEQELQRRERMAAVDGGRTRSDADLAKAMIKHPEGRTVLGLDPASPDAVPTPVTPKTSGSPTAPPVPPPSTVPPVQTVENLPQQEEHIVPAAAEGRRVLSVEEQKGMTPDQVRELIQSGEAVLVQDLA